MLEKHFVAAARRHRDLECTDRSAEAKPRGEPPKTYQNTVRLGLEEPRIHLLILGYWHTIVTPPMVFATLLAEIVEEMRGKGIDKPVVVSLAGDVEVEEASEYLFAHKIPAYPYSTEIPVDVLGAKYKWARGAGLL
jgi:acyl-CoA synthetase (NDP forming)